MKNLWIQTEHAFATWVANLDTLRADPSGLLQFAEGVLDSGAKHGVFEVVEAAAIAFHIDRSPSLSDRLRALYREHHVVDLFGFTGAAMAPGAPGSSTARATLAWFDENDQQVEGKIEDLGALLERLEPVEDSIPRGFMKHFPPVRITGRRLLYAGDPPKAQNLPSSIPITVRFAIHSDIWFPWVFGSAHPLCDHKRLFDNRTLAMRHTPRLNAFLQDVARSARALGGSWQVDDEETGKAARQWLDEDGIRLDAASPAALMPPSALDVEWS
jgi:hypothetical protein